MKDSQLAMVCASEDSSSGDPDARSAGTFTLRGLGGSHASLKTPLHGFAGLRAKASAWRKCSRSDLYPPAKFELAERRIIETILAGCV